MSELPEKRAPQLAGGRGTTNFHLDPSVRLISMPEAAAMLSISERLLWSLSACNAVPSLTIGRRRLYRPCELDAWLDAGAPTEPGSADRIRMGATR